MFTPWKINRVHLQITHLERNMIFQTSSIVFHVNHQGIMFMSTLPKFNSSPLKSYRNPIGKANVFQPSIFRGELLNFGGCMFMSLPGLCESSKRSEMRATNDHCTPILNEEQRIAKRWVLSTNHQHDPNVGVVYPPL